MKRLNRRAFLAGGTAASLIAGMELPVAVREAGAQQSEKPVGRETSTAAASQNDGVVDFRYAPSDFQSTICFPDDPNKTVVGKRGDLRYDFPADIFASVYQFGTILEFTLAGTEQDIWREPR